MSAVSAFAQGLLTDIADGYVPGPGQFRGLLRQLSDAGLIEDAGMKTLAMGVGPAIRVQVYALTADGNVCVANWSTNQTKPEEAP